MDLFNNRVVIERKDGTKIENVRCSVQERVSIPDTSVPIEVGDTITQQLPSGLTKKMLVTKVQVYDMGSQLDHISVDYVPAS